jgi:hypothetical protein
MHEAPVHTIRAHDVKKMTPLLVGCSVRFLWDVVVVVVIVHPTLFFYRPLKQN